MRRAARSWVSIESVCRRLRLVTTWCRRSRRKPGKGRLPGTPGVIFLMDFCGTAALPTRTDKPALPNGHMWAFNWMAVTAPMRRFTVQNIFFPIDEDIPFDEATPFLTS